MSKTAWRFGLSICSFILPEFFEVSDTVRYATLALGLVLMFWGAAGLLFARYGLRPAELIYDYKPWGFSIDFRMPVCLSGGGDDLRYGIFRARVKNNTKRWLAISQCYVENAITGERWPGRFNVSGDYPERGMPLLISEVRGIPPKAQGYLGIYFEPNFNGSSVNHADCLGVEALLRAWPAFDFCATIDGKDYRKHISQQRHSQEVNAALARYRSSSPAMPHVRKSGRK